MMNLAPLPRWDFPTDKTPIKTSASWGRLAQSAPIVSANFAQSSLTKTASNFFGAQVDKKLRKNAAC